MQEEKQLDQVVNKIVAAVTHGQKEITSIVRRAITERDELLSRLVELKSETLDILTQLDRLEHEEKMTQLHLSEIRKKPLQYNAQETQAAEAELRHIHQQLESLPQRELGVRSQRHTLEEEAQRVMASISTAQKLDSHLQMAKQLLGSGTTVEGVKTEDFQLRHQLGLRIIKAQEEERLRVAREIHDGPAQSMANVVLRAEICEKLMAVEPENVKAELQDLKEMVKVSLQEVRKIIFDLRPMVLDDLGIVPTLRRFIAELQKRTDMSIELVVLGGESERLASPLEVAIFRIVQEALNNILKHAKAKRCVIKLEIIAGRINITIADDGCGFDTGHVMQGTEMDCYGLLGMRERVELLDGQLRISSVADKGTEIHVRIPVKKG
jgi:two-component system sensor histidine kinase DegS